MKIVLRSLIRILEGLAIAAVLVVMVVFIQLARGPFPLSPFVPYVESALGRALPDYTFKIADAELTWKRMTRRPELTVQNVQVRNQNGAVIAAFGALDLSLDIPQLISGRVVVEHLGIARPVLRIVRNREGRLGLGVEVSPETKGQTTPEAEAEGGSALTTVLLDGLRVSPDDADSGPALENVEITQSTIVIVDEQSGLQWLVPDANFRLLGQRETIEIAGNLPLIGGGTTVNVDVAGRYSYEAGLLSLTASFNGLRPAVFATLSPELERLKILDAELKGSIEVNIIPDNLTSTASWGSANIVAGEGTLNLPPEWGGTVPISGMTLMAASSGGLDQIAVEKFEIRTIRQDGLSPVIGAAAKATNLRTAPDVDVQATIDGLTLQGLKELWPLALAPNTRKWIVENLNGGTVKNVTADIKLGGAEAWAVQPETLKLLGDLEGISVKYMKGMPNVENTAGKLTVGLEVVTVDVTAGMVPDKISGKGLNITGADLRMYDLKTPVPKADFDIKIKGDLADALRLIDNQPLGYATKMNVDPNAAAGDATVDLSLGFPLLSNLKLDDLKINVKAKLTDTYIDKVAFDLPLSEGDLELEVVNTGLAVKGNAKLGPIRTGIDWTEDFSGKPMRSQYVLDALVANEDRALIKLGYPPFIPPNIDGIVRTNVIYREMRDGTASLNATGDLTDIAMAIPQLGWNKPVGTKGEFSADVSLKNGELLAVPAFRVTAENDLEVEGSTTFGKLGVLKTLDIQKARANKTNIALKVLRQDDGLFVLDVTGPVFDASYYWKDFNQDEARGQRTDLMPGAEDVPVPPPEQTPVKLTANIDEMWLSQEPPLQDVSLIFERDKKAIQKIDLKSKVESGAAFDLTLGTVDGRRTFSGTSEDGGGVVRSLGLFDDIKGGTLTITGTLTPEGAIEGKADIAEFKLVDAPLVARVLSVAALTGIADELRGEGISFKTLDVPFSFADSTLRITDAGMFGSALGMTAQGAYRFSDSYIDMEGTVVPAYALNSAFNAIPILGTLLTGPEKGGGIFAAAFSWRGPSATAEPFVNPLSVLTPGITRKIFSIFGGGSTTPPPKVQKLPSQEPQPETVAPLPETEPTLVPVVPPGTVEKTEDAIEPLPAAQGE